MFGLEKRSALFLIAILALVGALVVAGCGGGGSSSSSETATTEEAETGGAEETTEEPAEEEPAEEAEKETGGAEAEGGGEAALSAEGKEVFTTNCASCHTLKEAGMTGEVGPNLDELEPDMGTVEHQVENGGGGMPSFKGTLSGTEIKAVASYVSSVAGTE